MIAISPDCDCPTLYTRDATQAASAPCNDPPTHTGGVFFVPGFAVNTSEDGLDLPGVFELVKERPPAFRPPPTYPEKPGAKPGGQQARQRHRRRRLLAQRPRQLQSSYG